MNIILLISLLFSQNIFSAEVDSYSQRHIDLQDSARELDLLANEWLSRVERKQKNCNQKRLVKDIVKEFTRFGWSKFETRVEGDNRFPQLYPLKSHIYSEFYTTLRLPKTMTSLMRVAGVWIGVDKFSHFFTEGHNYYKRYLKDNGSLNGAFNYGHGMEAGMWGMRSTGVYSYADLVANYEGLKFFLSLTKGDSPYFSCIQSRWVKVKDFKWAKYINHGWDEGINCNRFLSKKLETLFLKRIEDLENYHNSRLTCPVQPRHCAEIRARYSSHISHLVSPKCL